MIELDEINDATWAKLQLVPSKKNGSHSELICSGRNKKPDVFLNVSPGGVFRMLVDIPKQKMARIERVGTAGLLVEVGVLNVEFRGSREWAVVACTAPAHLSAFTHIVKEISALILVERADAVEAINSVIGKWKSFWGKPPGIVLSEEEQLGLVGELALLHQILLKRGSGFVRSWTGPTGKHDFHSRHVHLEVKTTLRGRHSHIINGIDQLTPALGKKLILVSQLAAHDDARGISLTTVVAAIERILKKSPADYHSFATMLAATRFRREHEQDYLANRFVFLGERWFEVSGGFPKLSSDNLKKGLSARISEVRYRLDLEGMATEIRSSAIIAALKI